MQLRSLTTEDAQRIASRPPTSDEPEYASPIGRIAGVGGLAMLAAAIASKWGDYALWFTTGIGVAAIAGFAVWFALRPIGAALRRNGQTGV